MCIQSLEYFGAASSARWRAGLFLYEWTRLLLLLLLGGVPEAHRNSVTPEQLSVPYIEKETPQDQRKKLLSPPPHPHHSPACLPEEEVGYVLGTLRAERAD